MKSIVGGVESNASWVEVERASSADKVWRCTRVYHLPPELNVGKHNVFVSTKIDGVTIRNGSLKAVWGWQGQRADEKAPPVVLNKRAPDPCGDIPIERGQHIWLKIVGSEGYQSDVVRNLHAEMDGTNGNSYGHHSYFVDFELQQSTTTTTPPPTNEDDLATKVAKLTARVDALEKWKSTIEGD